MALADRLAAADHVDYVSLRPKSGGVPSRRVVVRITTPGSGGTVRTDVWDGTAWTEEVAPESHSSDAALDTAAGIRESNADAANASEEAEQLLTDSATAVHTRLTTAGAPAPTVPQLKSAMNPGPGGQSVFDLLRKGG